MNKIISWLSNSFAPAMNKIIKIPWVAALASTMQKILPFILAGSLISFYGVIRDYISFLPDLSIIFTYTFGLLGILITFIMTNQLMSNLNHSRYLITASLTSISSYFIFIGSKIDNNGILAIEYDKLGPSGIFVGLVIGVFISTIFHFYAKLPFLKESNLPDFVVEWIHNIIPITLSIGLATFITFNMNIDVFNIVTLIFSPLQSFGQSLPGFVLICFIPAFFYTMGISSWVFNSVTTPIFMAGIAANIRDVSKGIDPSNIATSEVVFTAALVTMGGVGCTLALNIYLIFSKSKKLKVLGKVFILPSIFNINEPLMFGAPVVMNPILMLPVWISTIIGAIILWCSMYFNLLNIPAKMIQVGQIPAPFSSVMITEDFRAIILYIILFAIYMLIWFPFFKAFEKSILLEEQEEG